MQGWKFDIESERSYSYPAQVEWSHCIDWLTSQQTLPQLCTIVAAQLLVGMFTFCRYIYHGEVLSGFRNTSSSQLRWLLVGSIFFSLTLLLGPFQQLAAKSYNYNWLGLTYANALCLICTCIWNSVYRWVCKSFESFQPIEMRISESLPFSTHHGTRGFAKSVWRSLRVHEGCQKAK